MLPLLLKSNGKLLLNKLPSTSRFGFRHFVQRTSTKPSCFINQPKFTSETFTSKCTPITIQHRGKKTKVEKTTEPQVVEEVKPETKEPQTTQDKRPHTVLIDGSHIFYKSYFAHPFNPTKGAIYGLTRMLLKITQELQPYDYIGICFDPPGRKTFRDQLYPEYKKTRTEIAQEFKAQFPLIPSVAKAVNMSYVRILGFEADDVIATYTVNARNRGHRVTIVSQDKDLMQLVGPDVSLWDCVTAPDAVKEKWGVEPHLLPHLQCLTGDSSDNIKGVPGIGPKTAATLINTFGTIPEIIKKIDSITPVSRKKAIQENIDLINSNFNLVTLRTDVEVPALEDLATTPIVKDELMAFLNEHEFKSIRMQWIKNNPSEVTSEEIMEMKSYRSNQNDKRVKKSPVLDFVENKEAKPEEETEVEEEVSVDEEEEAKLPIPDFAVEDLHKLAPAGVTVVSDRETAKRVSAQLMTLTDRYHAVDTELSGFDLNKPVIGQDIKVICASIYVGPDVDFGNGPRIWIDNLGPCEGILNEFKEYFENKDCKKVFHNFSFDCHALNGLGIPVNGFGGDTMQMARLWNSSRIWKGGYSLQGLINDLGISTQKRSIKERFGKQKMKKDGTFGKTLVLPSFSDLQRDPQYVSDWIDYSTFDAEGTWFVREELAKKLKEIEWKPGKSMYDFYLNEWVTFGEMLVAMETEGIKVNVAYLKEIEKTAMQDYETYKAKFLEWATKRCTEAAFMNIESDAQKQQLLFAPCTNQKNKKKILEAERSFDTPNTVGYIEPGKTKPLKKLRFTIKGMGIPAPEYTGSGWPAVSSNSLKALAGDPKKEKWGSIYNFFSDPEEGKEACFAIEALLEAGKISTMLATFIQPLQEMVDSKSRIHTSLNINTETGRLSSRRPNLQNQPALEKDRYKIRDAFTCEEGNTLIVADYGQLELRILAHITACKSMIDAFKMGGDFHSRTAMGMYPEIREAVDQGKVLLEWDHSKGKPPAPLLKDAFAAHRRKAKTLNFSIAYGKTPMGLSTDWGVNLAEAEATLELWYSDRPEVREWQQNTIDLAHYTGVTRTLLGRYRQLVDISSNTPGHRAHSERAAINTPIQGGAADIVIRAMIKLYCCEELKKLGWRQILQIHDEIILEGPEETSKEAFKLVKSIMRNPLDEPLLVDLEVDAKMARTWFKAK